MKRGRRCRLVVKRLRERPGCPPSWKKAAARFDGECQVGDRLSPDHKLPTELIANRLVGVLDL